MAVSLQAASTILSTRHIQHAAEFAPARTQRKLDALSRQLVPDNILAPFWTLSMYSPIHSCGMTTLGDKLWSQVLWCATQGVCLLVCCKLLGKAKVGQLEVAVYAKQQVFWLQIPAKCTHCAGVFQVSSHWSRMMNPTDATATTFGRQSTQSELLGILRIGSTWPCATMVNATALVLKRQQQQAMLL